LSKQTAAAVSTGQKPEESASAAIHL